MAQQLLLQYPTRLNEQAAVDCLVRHLAGLVFRIRSLQPAGDLLGRPIQSEPFRNGPPEPRIGRQFTTFRTTSAVPGLLIGRRRAVTIIAAIAADFPAHRRGRAAQQPGYRSRRLIERYSSGYFLALCECQMPALSGAVAGDEFPRVGPAEN